MSEVREAFGVESLDELFEGFPDKPLASGSIGQVYRARLSASGAARARLPPGTVVAVKVRSSSREEREEGRGERERERERERRERKRGREKEGEERERKREEEKEKKKLKKNSLKKNLY